MQFVRPHWTPFKSEDWLFRAVRAAVIYKQPQCWKRIETVPAVPIFHMQTDLMPPYIIIQMDVSDLLHLMVCYYDFFNFIFHFLICFWVDLKIIRLRFNQANV